MKYFINWKKHTLKFKFKARTSRGCLTLHNCYIVQISSVDKPQIIGHGEASPLAGLSVDYTDDFEKQLEKYCLLLSQKELHSSSVTDLIPARYPSIRFAFETALLDLEQGGHQRFFKSNSINSNNAIPINGLIWMGDLDFMQRQIDQKLREGYCCLKIKVGSHNFNQEFQLIQSLRKNYSVQKLIIRLDANGSYPVNQVEKILAKWATLDIHSIEQPIAVTQIELMAKLCQTSPIAIALDEELIGIDNNNDRMKLLEVIKPAYIVLKPTLLGGFNVSEQWINIANALSINWWLTSALESNIGLNALAQFVAQYHPTLHQGLGTGEIYINNVVSKTYVESGKLFFK